ncbi:MAG: rhomboid family intramembrane serine protease [Acidobacteria bacterium]|nr:rhomboid family intramembrane serine protease [Acidobacteriota bacterium]
MHAYPEQERDMGGMIPLRDASREPNRYPLATTSIIVVNALVFALEIMGGDAFVSRWALLPSAISSGHHLVTIFTAMFMHAGWMHIIGNMIFLHAFGPEVEDAMGSGRYLAFYLLCGIVAALGQVAVAPHSTVLNLGASGAIAGVMGAFLVTYPADRIKAVFFFFIFFKTTFIPAALLIGVWFVMQIFDQVGAVAATQGGGVAYAAHVSGMICGAVIARPFESFRRQWEA